MAHEWRKNMENTLNMADKNLLLEENDTALIEEPDILAEGMDTAPKGKNTAAVSPEMQADSHAQKSKKDDDGLTDTQMLQICGQ